MTGVDVTVSGEGLRAAMVDQLVADHAGKGLIMRPDVEAALKAVPRHLFTPGAGTAAAIRAVTCDATRGER